PLEPVAKPTSGVAAEKDVSATAAAALSLAPATAGEGAPAAAKTGTPQGPPDPSTPDLPAPDPPGDKAAIASPDPLSVVASARQQPSADPIAAPGKAPSRGDVDKSKAKGSRVRARARQQVESGAAATVPSTPPTQAIAPTALVLPPSPLSGSTPHGDSAQSATPADTVVARSDGRQSVGTSVETAEPAAKAPVSAVITTPVHEAGAAIASPPPLASVAVADNVAPGTPSPPASRTETPQAPVATVAVPHAPDPSPAGQIAPVMVSLASSGTGTHRLVMRLDPPELGRLEISLVRTPDTGTRVEITAERPTTLALLHQDAPALHQALSDAGVPVDGRSLTMQLGQPGSQSPGGYGGGNGEPGARRFAAWSGGGAVEALSDPSPFPTLREMRSALDITA
ncbi:MAG: flagellar hook-length control protein FliK, partial [Acetobacteraceae bacterium]